MVYCGLMSNPISCPACNALMIEDKTVFYGCYMHVCFNCGKPWEISCYDDKEIKVGPFDADGDPMIEGIILWNFHKGRHLRGIEVPEVFENEFTRDSNQAISQ